MMSTKKCYRKCVDLLALLPLALAITGQWPQVHMRLSNKLKLEQLVIILIPY